jgi:hypothetical protein
MASVPPVSGPTPILSDSSASVTKIEVLGVKVEAPLPKWAVASLAVILLIAAVGASVYWSVTNIGKTVIIPAAQAEVYEETNFHLTEPKELKEAKEEIFNNLTTVTINYFRSDGCVQIVRWDASTNKGDGIWMFGPHPHTPNHSHALTSSLPPLVGRRDRMRPPPEILGGRLMSKKSTQISKGTCIRCKVEDAWTLIPARFLCGISKLISV